MLPRLTRARRTLVALAASVALVPALGGTASAVPPTPDGPDYGAPTVGECHSITLDAASKASETSAPVDCSTTHTTRVIAVGHLPDGVDWSQTGAVYKAAIRTCQPALNKTLGQDMKVRDRSAYSLFWFSPTADQQTHGATWIRCDVGLLGGSKLLALPTDDVPALSSAKLGNKVARCLAPKTFRTTTCAHKHVYRATGAFTMKSDTFPGAKSIQKAAIRKCPSLTNTRYFAWTYRGKVVWNVGKDHVVVCYSKRTS